MATYVFHNYDNTLCCEMYFSGHYKRTVASAKEFNGKMRHYGKFTVMDKLISIKL